MFPIPSPHPTLSLHLGMGWGTGGSTAQWCQGRRPTHPGCPLNPRFPLGSKMTLPTWFLGTLWGVGDTEVSGWKLDICAPPTQTGPSLFLPWAVSPSESDHPHLAPRPGGPPCSTATGHSSSGAVTPQASFLVIPTWYLPCSVIPKKFQIFPVCTRARGGWRCWLGLSPTSHHFGALPWLWGSHPCWQADSL